MKSKNDVWGMSLAVLVSLILAFFSFAGFIYRNDRSVLPSLKDFTNPQLCLGAVLLLIFVFVLSFATIYWLRTRLMQNQPVLVRQSTWQKTMIKLLDWLFSSWWKLPLIIFVFWLPYFIVMFPGIGSYDTDNQLKEFWLYHIQAHYADYANNPLTPENIYPTSHYLIHNWNSLLTDQHNILLTMIYGRVALFSFNHFHDIWQGIALLSFSQMILTLAAFSYLLSQCYHLVKNKFLIGISVIFVLLNPVFALNSFTLTKNQLFASGFLFAAAFLISQMRKGFAKKLRVRDYVLILFFAFTLMISVKYGTYIVLAIMVCLLFFRKKIANYTVAALLASLVIFTAGKSFAMSDTRALPSDPIEMYSIPVQQTARYMRTTPNDLTVSQRKNLSKVFYLQRLIHRPIYNPDVSDNIKSSGYEGRKVGGYRYTTVTRKQVKEYTRHVWIALSIRHPMTLIDSFMAKNYGYLDFLAQPLSNSVFGGLDSTALNFSTIHMTNDQNFPAQKAALYSVFMPISSNGIYDILFRANFWAVLSVLMLAAAIWAKKYRLLLLLLPLIFQILFGFVGPTNYSQRYMIVFAYMSPFICLLPELSRGLYAAKKSSLVSHVKN